MPGSTDFHYDVASGIALGRREVQEDAVICDFPLGSCLGFAVLSDGMGGHAAGDVASKIVVTEVFSELKLQSGDPDTLQDEIAGILLDAALGANDCIGAHSNREPGTRGMGATLLAPVLMGDLLYWVSVGDSPLLLFRDATLSQLNEDHSMAPQIDFLARSGMMETETALNHPDRNCLTSVLGGQKVTRIDCPTTPFQLMEGDIVIATSDGLQFLGDDEISALLTRHTDKTSAEISRALLERLDELDDPEQDNISFCVIRISELARQAGAVGAGVRDPAIPRGAKTPAITPGMENVTLMTSTGESGMSMVCRVSKERRA